MTQRLDYTAIAPAGIKALGSVYGYIVQSGLPRLLVNLVYLRASQINGCAGVVTGTLLATRNFGRPIVDSCRGSSSPCPERFVSEDAERAADVRWRWTLNVF